VALAGVVLRFFWPLGTFGLMAIFQVDLMPAWFAALDDSDEHAHAPRSSATQIPETREVRCDRRRVLDLTCSHRSSLGVVVALAGGGQLESVDRQALQSQRRCWVVPLA